MDHSIKKSLPKKLILLGITLLTLSTITACNQLDSIGKGSSKSFDEIVNEIPDNVTSDEDNSIWSLEAPDESARFIWSQDFSKTEYDAKLELDLEPFLAAGLDITMLPEEMIQEDKIVVGVDLGEDELSYDDEITPLSSYKQIVKHNRDYISYHSGMDHYGIDLGNGNMFEWANNMSKNDKDIVFVLDPNMFVEAGVNPEEIEGWVYAKVEIMDKSGKMKEVDKLLKPFDLK